LERVIKLRKEIENKKYKVSSFEKPHFISEHKKIAKEMFGSDILSCEGKVFSLGDLSIKADRLVIGAHGPYIEFDDDNINKELVIPREEEWRLDEKYNVKYIHFVPKGRNEKIYYQMSEVSYADYKIKKCYIDLYYFKK